MMFGVFSVEYVLIVILCCFTFLLMSKKGEKQMNLSMGRSFLFDMNAYIEGELIMLIDIICICISLGGVFLIYLICVLSSSKKGDCRALV